MLTASKKRDATKPDGRVQRSERSKAAIVDALLELLGEGELEPTAEQVAERASVGIRTVFRHFKDMDTLYGAMDTRVNAQYGPAALAPVPKVSLSRRVDEFVERRAALYEGIAPIKRAASLKRPHSKLLQDLHASLVRRLAKDLSRWFPELANAKPEVVHAMELVTSFEAWNRLRVEQRLGKPRATAAMRRAITALL